MENSTNTGNVNPQIAVYLMAMRSEIGMLRIDEEKKREALKIVNALDMQFESGRPDKEVVKKLISTLPHAAIVASISSSLLACL